MSLEKKFLSGFATEDGTSSFKDFAIRMGVDNTHFKRVEGLHLSSLGMGTYLGNLSSQDDDNIEKSLEYCIGQGSVNVIDTAINYRAMLSEKSIGRTISRLVDKGEIKRENVFICTKNGYATNDGEYRNFDIETYLKKMYIDNGTIESKDISPAFNIMNPKYISHCINKSLCNLGLETIDLVYIHNSYESWFNQVAKKAYLEMLSRVFEVYEDFRKSGKIRFYGMATWNCFTSNQNSPNYLSLSDVISIAKKVGGSANGLKFLQLPYNYIMKEPFNFRNQIIPNYETPVSILEAAKFFGIHVFTSIPLYQGRLLDAKFDDSSLDKLSYQSAKLLQFVRSTPGVVAPLIGQKQLEHTKQNISVSKYPFLKERDFARLMAIDT